MAAFAQQRPARLRGARILIVEDDTDTREMMAELSREEGAVVSEAASGRVGFEVFERERPDVVVSDLWMSDGDGFELVRRIRALPPERGGLTPAIAMSAAENVRSALMAGFHTFAAKPFEIDGLFDVIADFVAGAEDRPQTVAPWTVREAGNGVIILAMVGHVRAADIRGMLTAVLPRLSGAPREFIVDLRGLSGFAPSVASVAQRVVWDRRRQIRHIRVVGGSTAARLVSTAACALLGIPCTVADGVDGG
jgi:CheY-like chemotaxis protein